MKNEILVIDDNSDIRFLICNILKEKDYIVRSAANCDQAIMEIKKKLPDLAIIDIKLDKGEKDGIDLLKLVMNSNKKVPVIMISGHANVQVAVEAIRIGAYEFLEKPFSTEKLLNYVKRGLESASLKVDKENLESKLFHSFELIGESSEISKIKKNINKIAIAESRILISGETGTGKELIARKIHKNSLRSKHPFVVLNSALLNEQRYEKELFGEELNDGTISYGVLEKSNMGTLLIDEVSEIPLATQANILRVLIDQKFKRVNGSKDINVNIRIISTTSKNLQDLVNKELFREDFFHRLNVLPLEVPSLQSRSSDIPLLINYFKNKLAELNGVKEINLDTSNDLLYAYKWPGNIRELRNLVERITILSVNENEKDTNQLLSEILTKDPKISSVENTFNNAMKYPLKEAREEFEKKYLLNKIRTNNGNISNTAADVGMERSALHRKLKSLGIKGIN